MGAALDAYRIVRKLADGSRSARPGERPCWFPQQIVESIGRICARMPYRWEILDGTPRINGRSVTYIDAIIVRHVASGKSFILHSMYENGNQELRLIDDTVQPFATCEYMLQALERKMTEAKGQPVAPAPGCQ